ncbi:MAG TPA: archaellar assembly protein FlaJ [Methanocella sp.]|uniref:archaellar assembly protein FlaJ n=1 Tax=Methanocella sp. TaxID=2052833 RepID=UPI002BF5CA12|nr:archaellar assembly protein FlaJ [Methanocella sp.]HTY89697.1 archaellar assembly protein FlaJ [Methanocella sp.]
MSGVTANSEKAKKSQFSLKGLLNSFLSLFEPIISYFRTYMENNRIDIDVLYMVTYMNSIATANISRDEIFKRVSERDEYACSKYMNQVYVLAKNWNYEYGTACNIVAERVSNWRLKDLLMRLSNAMAAGEPEAKFLESEWQTMMVIYKNEYERSLESMKKWTDAYTALLVSVSFMSVTVLLSTCIYNMGDPETMIGATLIVIALIAGIGSFVLRSEAPKELKTHSMETRSPEQDRIKDMSKILLPVAAILSIAMFAVGVDMGIILIVLGLIIAPMGLIGWRDNKNVTKRDEDYSQFIKMLGSVVGSMGLTVKEGITKVDQKSIGSLEPLVQKLYIRLVMGLDPKVCWNKFIGNSGSELISKFTHIFTDAIDMGGDADRIGKLVNNTNMEVVLLRMKRRLVSSSFTTLIFPMHTAMCALTLFVIQILIIFSGMITNLYSTMSFNSGTDISGSGFSVNSLGFTMFQNVPTHLLATFGVALVVILTIADTLSAKYVDGGDTYMLYFYGSIMAVLSGIVLLVVPVVVQSIFTFTSLSGV